MIFRHIDWYENQSESILEFFRSTVYHLLLIVAIKSVAYIRRIRTMGVRVGAVLKAKGGHTAF